MDMDDVKTSSGNKDRAPGVADLTAVFKFPERKWISIRLRKRGVFTTASYWVKTKRKDGSKTQFPTPCPSYDPDTQERDSTKYDPWREVQEAEAQKYGGKGATDKEKDKQNVRFSKENWMEAIIRIEQDKAPRRLPKPTAAERKSGYKDKDSDTWTPVRVVKLGNSLMGKVQELKALNVVRSKSSGTKAFSVDDDKYGRDIRVFYDPKKPPADQYQVQLGDERTPLTEEEMAYLGWDLATATASEVPEKPTDKKDKEGLKVYNDYVAALKKDFEGWAKRNSVNIAALSGDDDEDEDEDEKPKRGTKKPAAKAKGKSRASDDDDDDDDDDADEEDDDFDDEEDEEEDEKPKRSSKKPAAKKPAAKSKAKRKSSDDDEDEEEEDDDDDFDEDEEEEDEKPKRSSKAKAKPVASKSKRKASSDDDEDEEEDDDFDEDEEEEDEEEEKPKRGAKAKPAAKKPVAKKKKVVDDDDFDDEEEDEEDEEEEDEKPKRKTVAKKPAAKSKVVAKKKKVVDDDDDFDDEEEDEDEDEEEEKPKRKPAAKSSSKKPVVKKKKVVDDDDDDDFDDDDE